jgi:hypothetical protein
VEVDGIYQEYGFLFRYGGSLVLGVLVGSIVLNGVTALMHFLSGSVLLGFWALAATLMLPKAVLGLVLIMARRTPIALLSLPMLFYSLFTRTVQRYRGDNLMFEVVLHGARNGYIREGLWLVAALIPIAALALRRL